MWECGLKLVIRLVITGIVESLLMWECGLKHFLGCNSDRLKLSLLMWECGLKPTIPIRHRQRTKVTPYVGVWIETVLDE